MSWCVKNKGTRKVLRSRKFATRTAARRECARLNRRSPGKYTVVRCR